MNKADLINHIAVTAGLTLEAAGKVLDAVTGGISSSLVRGEGVSLVGFGNFSVTARPQRTGRNPQTGAEIVIAASKAPKFSAGKKLKEAVNA
jgi:nucleoid DNA-binding protein